MARKRPQGEDGTGGAEALPEQQNITEFESQFSGTYPFTSDGVVVGTGRPRFL